MTEVSRLLAAYAALLLLLAITVGSAFLELGALNPVLNIGIAAAKTAVIGLFFMHFLAHGPLPRLTALAVGLWLAILFALTMIDYA